MYNKEAQKKYAAKIKQLKINLIKNVDIEEEIIERFDLVKQRDECKKDFFIQMYECWKKTINIKTDDKKDQEKSI
jgi:hypothetical protein